MKDAIRMISDQIKTFEGYYRSPINKRGIEKIVAGGDDLLVINKIQTFFSLLIPGIIGEPFEHRVTD